ncbi:helix-turn-helix transcriptional regulator [Elioraea rosea]|uniref:helix-turn-helix transcriptional regulator n=1 Tax=Elioraea rosea TaxID=2492390 RepID=UPI001181CAC2|nr:helix-turn-helix domain-containing protein [Elioraea rosea]
MIELLSERDLRDRYGIPERTSQRWRMTGDGPPYVRLGARRVAYRRDDVEAWLDARTFPHRAAETASAAG